MNPIKKPPQTLLVSVPPDPRGLQLRIERLERTLGTLIVWLQRDLGDHGVQQLLESLHPKR